MTVEEAIGKATEAGFVTGFTYDRMAAVDPLGAVEVIFLDPSFWQSLGKAMGWKNQDNLAHLCPKHERGLYEGSNGTVCCPGTEEGDKLEGTDTRHVLYRTAKDALEKGVKEKKYRMWKFYWHRFIDHLAEGKSAESFFADL